MKAYDKQPRNRAVRRKRRTGWDQARYDAYRDRQQGRCAICLEERPLVSDHDHRTGRPRELLCHLCNFGLGHFRDSPELLVKAEAYLKIHGEQAVA